MDANGTRFHLISGEQDWQEVLDASSDLLSENATWDSDSQGITLRSELPIFPRGRRAAELDPAARRGAACDRFGSWYWIGQDHRTLFRSPAGTVRAVPYWQQTAEVISPDANFIPQTPPPLISDLAGLAVTAHHYLVVGTLQSGGLLIFDLHSGGEPLRLEFPSGQPFEPFDLTAAPDGGVWILDRANHRLWGLDRYFRLLPLNLPSAVPLPPGSFSPEGSEAPPLGPLASPPPSGLSLPTLDPIAVEALPNGDVLVLDRPASLGEHSRLFHYRPGTLPGTLVLAGSLPLPDLTDVAEDNSDHPVLAYDFAYLPQGEHLYVVEAAGNQTIDYKVTLSEIPSAPLTLKALATYLPMHYFGARAVVTGVSSDDHQAIFYDVTPFPEKDLSVRWIQLRSIPEPRYQRLAWVETPIFDSHSVSCIWHRLFLDACIPPETTVQIWTRCGDDDDLLEVQAYRLEPDPYLRSMGSEIPYWEGWQASGEEGPKMEYAGTWETLFQNARGRYLQLRLRLAGNGRASPAICRLRVYYPRFSYVKSYLPAAYSEEPASASFLERMLANMEGFYTEFEGKISHARVLFDPYTAPAESLDWLGTWVGLVLDPLWSKVDMEDRRRLIIRFARRLYEHRGTPDGLRFAVLLLIDPCLHATLRQLELATVVSDQSLREQLEALSLPYPGLGTGEAELEELLFRFVLSAPGRSRVRIVEHWQTRQGAALQAWERELEEARQALQEFAERLPDMNASERQVNAAVLSRLAEKAAQAGITQLAQALAAVANAAEQGNSQAAQAGTRAASEALAAGRSIQVQQAMLRQALQETAHRFSVLVPENLPAEQAAMVEKIVRLEKPAHTQMDIRRFWDYFLVGQARLEIETILGEEGRFLPIILGRDYLSEGYLDNAYPMDVTKRTVSDRDRLGDMRL